MEERDTCPSCGLPKAWCRDPQYQFKGFEAREETCFATYALALHRKKVDEDRAPESRAATQTSVRFADGVSPNVEAGLDLAGHPGDESDEGDER